MCRRADAPRIATAALLLPLLAGALAGCAQQGPLLSRRTTMGSLKASVSHLELENSKLRTEVAGLKQENRQLDERLVQEEAANGDLAARLDDARTLLTQRGWGEAEDDPSGRRASDPFDSGSTTRPVARPRQRKPPVARIPGRAEIPPPDFDDADPFGASPPAPRRPAGRDRDLFQDAQSRREADSDATWLPVARGNRGPIGARVIR